MAKNKFVGTLIFLFINLAATFAQDSLYQYVVFLSDKNESVYNVSDPASFLSKRSIERRARQDINISTSDLPIVSKYLEELSDLPITIKGKSKWLNAVLIESVVPQIDLDIILLPFVNGVKKVAQYFDDSQMSTNEITGLRVNHGSLLVNSILRSNRGLEYGYARNQIEQFNGQALHEKGFMGEGMLIAVIDGGFRGAKEMKAFDHLFAEDKIIATRNFVQREKSVYSAAKHGSTVLSAMAAKLDGLFLGSAPEASYILVISEDVRSEQLVEEFNYVQGLEFADSLGVDVVNTSLGYTQFNDGLMNHHIEDLDGNQAMATRGADMAAGKGILVVNSAGNLGNKAWQYISVPADGDSVLAVGAVDNTGKIGAFSSKGYKGHLSVKPNVVAQGVQCAVVNVADSIVFSNGTSFSSPLISGMAACLWQANRTRGNMDIFKAIEESSSQYFNPDNSYGYGIPNFEVANEFLKVTEADLIVSDDELLVFPNPFTSSINIRLKEDVLGPVSYEIFNELGRKVAQISNVSEQGLLLHYDFGEASTQSSGIYVLRLKTQNKVYTSRLLKVQASFE